MFVDSHCHLEMEEYDQDRQTVIERSVREGVSRMVTVGTEMRYYPKVMELIDRDPQVYGAIGIHPHNAGTYSDSVGGKHQGISRPSQDRRVRRDRSDFYRDYAPRGVQETVFRRQIEVARSAELPIIIHSRNAKRETIEILKEARLEGHGIVIHCYSYDTDTARTVWTWGPFFPSRVPLRTRIRNCRKWSGTCRSTGCCRRPMRPF